MRTVLVVLFLALATSAQSMSKCELNIEKSPALRGLRLGMSPAVLKSLLTGSTFEPIASEDVTSVLVTPGRGNPNFTNVRYIKLELLGDRLTKLSVSYDADWPSTKEFAADFSPKLNLSATAWVDDIIYFKQTCKGFEVRLTNIGSIITLVDTDAYDELESRKADAAAAKRKALKP